MAALADPALAVADAGFLEPALDPGAEPALDPGAAEALEPGAFALA